MRRAARGRGLDLPTRRARAADPGPRGRDARAARDLRFEYAARLRDEIHELRAGAPRSCAEAGRLAVRRIRCHAPGGMSVGVASTRERWATDSRRRSAARASTTSRTSTSSCPRDQLIVFTGLVRFGQVVPGVRHDLRRGPAPLRRVAVGVRPAVPRARWTSPTSTSSKGCRRRSRSTRSRRRATRARRSGTITEIYDYLRLLYARIGIPHCPNCGRLDHPPDPAADRRPGAAAARRHAVPGARAGRARPQGRVRQAPRRAGRQGVSPERGSTARSSSSPSRVRLASATSSTRSRSSSTGWSPSPASSGASPTRSRRR